ncbi:MAG: hypothetical protein RL328_2787, partial [Acidobacteriota bacterium]
EPADVDVLLGCPHRASDRVDRIRAWSHGDGLDQWEWLPAPKSDASDDHAQGHPDAEPREHPGRASAAVPDGWDHGKSVVPEPGSQDAAEHQGAEHRARGHRDASGAPPGPVAAEPRDGRRAVPPDSVLRAAAAGYQERRPSAEAQGPAVLREQPEAVGPAGGARQAQQGAM